ncbi:MAG TPA: nucleotidyltransferase family protein [Tepidisphaeraceae bacterium]|jgi:predicted nucleotidyltransferase
MKVDNINVPIQQIEAFCHKWKIKEFSLFGSILRGDFRADSDVDVLVTFAPGGGQTFENFLELRDELSQIFGGREVDLVEKRLLRNPFRRHEILTTREVVYAA